MEACMRARVPACIFVGVIGTTTFACAHVETETDGAPERENKKLKKRLQEANKAGKIRVVFPAETTGLN